MPLTRRFLDWQQPALHSAVEFLVHDDSADRMLQLDRVLLVVPGQRAGRRLAERLLDTAKQRGWRYLLPEIVTPERLPELLYEPKLPFASKLAQQLAWTQALEQAPDKVLARVVPHRPADDDQNAWRRLGTMLQNLHRELAGDGLDFAAVADRGAELADFNERDRWHALAAIQQQYLRILDGHELWDRQTARLFAIEHRECHTDRDILLLAMADLNGALRQMLDQVADRTTALVFAPESLVERFDDYGCVNPAAWEEADIDIRDEQIHVAEDAAGQAEAVVRCMADFNGQYRADEIRIGMGDDKLAPKVEHRLAECGIAARWLEQQTLPRSGPYKLLESLRDYLANGRSDDFTSLVRHSQVHGYLKQHEVPAVWLLELDDFVTNHLPVEISLRWLEASTKYSQLANVYRLVDRQLLEPLKVKGRQPLADWMAALGQVLACLYDVDEQKSGRERQVTFDACQALANAVAECERLPPALAPKTSAAEAIDFVLREAAGDVIFADREPGAVEMLGWLELSLDDAPAMVVMNFNEGSIPSSATGDLFLPNRLRAHLGVVDNHVRYARDAYALASLLATREQFHLVVARYDTDSRPLCPSRLLFATDAESIAQRVLRINGEDSRNHAGSVTQEAATSGFSVPAVEMPTEPIERLRVTAFRKYLQDPYQFYLEHLQGLKVVPHEPPELDALQFGTLLHNVLADFGNSDVRDATVAEPIHEFLLAALARRVAIRFGKRRRAAVNVQLAQMKLRLAEFATWQANWCGAGWHVEHVESATHETGVRWDVDGQPFFLTGTIDRIDVNDAGKVCLFDYKSSATAKSPDSVHRQGKKHNKQWVDLQLPLYRHLANELGYAGDVVLGYINLPKDVSQTGEKRAAWSAEELDDADETARNVIRAIRRGEFLMAGEPLREHNGFARIRMEGVFGGAAPPAAEGTQ